MVLPTDTSTMFRALLTLLASALCALALCASDAVAAPAEYAGSSDSGAKVFFTTAANLVPGDTDSGFVDIYERFYDPAPGLETFVTREISTGPTGGNDSYNVSFDAVSEDGTYVFFSTSESLVEEDHDHSRDVYQRNTVTGETALLSGGSPLCAPCGSAELPVTFVGAAKTGSDVFFTSAEGLVEGDQDGSSDVYVREAAAVAPVLATPGGSAPTTFLGTGPGGTKVVFETTDQLSSPDKDSEADIYERDLSGGTTQLVSVNGTCPAPLTPEECAPVYRATTKGGFVLFETKAQLTVEDQDKSQDVYRWSPTVGTVTLVSTGGEGEEGKGERNSVFAGTAREGTTVYFETAESLSSSDEDSAFDVYEWTGGSTSLVSTGNAEKPATFAWASADGSAVLFNTEESLQGSDAGEKADVYERNGATVGLVSAGSSAFDSTFAGSSSDGSHVFYGTSQQLDPADVDANADIYEWTEGAAAAWVSRGPVGGNGAFVPHLAAVAEDASHVFFTTRERLTADDDFTSENDVYDRAGIETVLVSVGNDAELQLGPSAPSLTGSNPSSPNTTVEPRIFGQAEAGTSIKIYPTADCSGAPSGIGSATELNGSGVKVTVKAGSTTTFHATATNASGDTSACSSSAVTYVQQSELPPPPPEESSGGGSSGGGGGGSGSTGGSTPPPAGSGESKSGAVPPVVRIGNFIYVAPLTKITVGPLSKTHSRRPVFQFIDTNEQPNTKFFCRIDREGWKACGSPYRPKHRLSLRKHAFAVKGESFAGQWEQRPVVRKFKVVGR
jgi:hypothetical protein